MKRKRDRQIGLLHAQKLPDEHTPKETSARLLLWNGSPEETLHTCRKLPAKLQRWHPFGEQINVLEIYQ